MLQTQPAVGPKLRKEGRLLIFSYRSRSYDRLLINVLRHLGGDAKRRAAGADAFRDAALLVWGLASLAVWPSLTGRM